jgi:3-hydroxybutyrate dehydrogenase
LVTGAGRGIGRAVALAFAREGAAVALVARTAEQIESVAREIREHGGRALAIAGDVSDASVVDRAVAAAESEFGGVDILVNNAGGNQLGAIGVMAPEDWWKQIEVNLKGAYMFSRALVPRMVERRWGRVITVSSRFGKIGAPMTTSYSAAKHALIGLTRALALEVAESGVTVNAICPGQVQTSLMAEVFAQRAKLWGVTEQEARERMILASNPQRRLIEVDELVPTFLFLASEGAARITGESVNVSSGAVMH